MNQKKKIGRKLLSFLLTLAMVVGLVPGMSLTAYADEGTKLTDGGTLSAGTYYLDGDLTLSSNIQVNSGEVVIINLNGHTLKGNGNGSVIHIGGGSLTVENGTITGGTTGDDFNGGKGGGAFYVNNGGSITVNNCILTGNRADYGNAFYMKGGSATVNNTTITGTNKEGYALWLQGNNDPKTSFTMNGGTISGFSWGAFVQGKSDLGTSEFTMNGGCISGNEKGVRNEGPNSKIIISGDAIVSNNDNHNVELNDGIKVSVASALGENADIGIYMNSSGEFTNSTDTTLNDASKFNSDNTNYAVGKNADGQLYLGTPVKVTYKVVNGTWSDGSTGEKAETVASGSKPASVPTGMKASGGYTGGAWDTDPAETTITEATTFTYTFTAKQAATVTKAPEAKSLTYTGSAQELVTAGTASGGTMQYALGENATTAPADNLYTTSIPTATNAGTYYVWYKVNGDANHNNTEPVFVEAKINPVDRADLNKAIKEVGDYYNTIKDNPVYSEQAKALSDAIKAAKELADNKNVTATEVGAGITAVTEAKKKVEAEVKDIDDAAAAKKVTDAINAIPTSDKVATTDKAAIEAARKAYDALSADQKAKVPADTLKKLTDAEKALTAAEKKAAEDKAAAEKKAAEEKAARELEAAKQEAQASMNEQVTVTQKGNKFTVKWKKSSSADGYYVYASYCGKKATKPAKTIKKNTTTKATITKINGKKINQKKNFHVYVVPYKIIDGKKVTLGKSTVAHLVGSKNAKYSNVKKLTLTKSKYTVKVGKTAKIKAKVTLVNKNKKHIPKSHGAKFRYKSSDTGIATVDKNGKIKGIKKGTCTIYVYSINGLTKKAKVTVK